MWKALRCGVAYFLVATAVTGGLLALQPLLIQGVNAEDRGQAVAWVLFMAAFAAFVGALMWPWLVRLMDQFALQRPLADALVGALFGLLLTLLFGPEMGDALSRLSFLLGFSAASLVWWRLRRPV